MPRRRGGKHPPAVLDSEGVERTSRPDIPIPTPERGEISPTEKNAV